MSQDVNESRGDLMTLSFPPPVERPRRFNVTRPTSNDLGQDWAPIATKEKGERSENLSWEKATASRFFGFLVLPQGTSAITLRDPVRLSACKSTSGRGPSDLGFLLVP